MSKTRLEAAKSVLRRTGKTVYDAKIEAPRFKGDVYVDGRRLKPKDVLAMAASVLAREAKRNDELRRQHGLPTQKGVK